MYNLAQKCIQLKPSARCHKLVVLLTGILEENTEVRYMDVIFGAPTLHSSETSFH